MLRSRIVGVVPANPLIDRAPVKPFDPIADKAAVARSAGQGRPDICPSIEALFVLPRIGRRSGRRSPALEGSEHGGRLSACRDGGARITVRRCIALLSACTLLVHGSTCGAAELPPQGALKPCARTAIAANVDWSGYVREAARRFDLPERLIRAVMHVESVGDVHVVSPKGAMGLMQIMPATWEELRTKHRLGNDPFNPRDNILAGAAYLREMLDRFGPKGFLAAYNAGPQRYEEHISKSRPLPRETIDYVAKLTRLISGAVEIPPGSRGSGSRSSADRSQLFGRGAVAMNDAMSWRNGGVDLVDQTVFTEIRSAALPSQINTAVNDLTALEPPPDTEPEDARTALRPAINSLFIPRALSELR